MRSSPVLTGQDWSIEPSYEVRVRGTVFLWGSDGLIVDMDFDAPLALHVRNDLFGETIAIGTKVASGARTTLGTLEAGECVSVPLRRLSGVFAACERESTVACLIKRTT